MLCPEGGAHRREGQRLAPAGGGPVGARGPQVFLENNAPQQPTQGKAAANGSSSLTLLLPTSDGQTSRPYDTHQGRANPWA